jgi:WD40 repeat protein
MDRTMAEPIAEMVCERPNGMILSCAFSPDGTRVVTGSDIGVVNVWDVRTQKLKTRIELAREAINVVVFSPDGKLVVLGDNSGVIRLCDSETGREIRTLREHEERVTALAYSADGTRLASSSTDGTVRVWDTKQWRQLLRLLDENSQFLSVCFSRVGQTIFAGDLSGRLHVWNLADGTATRTYGHDFAIRSVLRTPDERWLVTAGYDGAVLFWSTDGRSIERRL